MTIHLKAPIIALAVTLCTLGTGLTLANSQSPQDWKGRRDTFHKLTASTGWIQDSRTVDAILDAQEQENALLEELIAQRRSARRELGEAYLEFYYSDLGPALITIIKERPSRRALEIALRTSYNPDSEFASLLATAVQDAPDLLVAFSMDPREHQQVNAANILKLVAASASRRKGNTDADSRMLLGALVRLTRSPSSFARAEAAIGLGHLQLPEAAKELERLEREDPSDAGHGRGLTVADIARASLARLRDRKH